MSALEELMTMIDGLDEDAHDYRGRTGHETPSTHPVEGYGGGTVNTEPKYCDFYGMLSYKDFLTHTEAGTLAGLTISTRTDEAAL
jgi:hypothetical protein